MTDENKFMSNKLPKKISEKRFEQLINELVCDSCGGCGEDYCFLKKFILSLHPEPVVLVQLKCIEKFKWSESEKEGEDIGWNEAGFRWAERGYAKAFRDVFDADLSVQDVYDLTLIEYKNDHP